MSVKGKGRPAERRKGDLVVKCQPTANGGHRKFVLFFIADVYGAGTESARRTYVDQFSKERSGHPWLAERRKGDLVVKGLFEGKERPSLACGT